MKNNKYKVRLIRTYVISVTAESEAEAIETAEMELWYAESTNTAHYFESADRDTTVFDVTGTDDADF